MDNTAIKLNLNVFKNKKIKPKRITTKFTNLDSFNLNEKVIFMHLQGYKGKNISHLLNISTNKTVKIIFEYYKKPSPKKEKTNIPDNYLPWNSQIMFNHLKTIRKI